IDEWQFIGILENLAIPGSFGTPDEDRHVAEPTTEDLRASRERSRVADISLSAHASSGLGQGREVTLRFRAENLGPEASTRTTVHLDLPSGLTFSSCSASGGTCAALGARVAARFDSLALGAVGELIVQARTGCELGPTGSLSVRAEAYSTSSDPVRSNDTASTLVELST